MRLIKRDYMVKI